MQNHVKGKIIKGVGGLYSVRIPSPDNDSPTIVKCRARGAFRHDGITPLPGDNVLLSIDKDSSDRVIDSIEDRKNSLIRPPMANLDYLFITMASASPTPIPATVDKLISIAEFNNIEPIIVITKNELDRDEAKRLYDIYSPYFTCFSVSATTGEGIDEIEDFINRNINGHIAAFAGASGIGKSTLLNKLFPSLNLGTGDVSRKTERGKHTTRQVELFALSDDEDCGYIADTPGFSLLDFQRFDFFEVDDLPSTFREFTPLIGECRYKKCSHTKEEGCAIIEAVKQGRICGSRHESYVELFSVLKQKKKWN